MTTFLDSQTGRATPIESDPVRLDTGRPAIVLLRLIAAFAMVAVALACAVLLWLAPWPVDALAAVAASVAWTSWIDNQEQR